jgi:PAS domain S-box-containing protein
MKVKSVPNELFLLNVSNNFNNPYIANDVNQKIVIFNEGAERIFGYLNADLPGKPPGILFPPSAVDLHKVKLNIQFIQYQSTGQSNKQHNRFFGPAER